MTLQATYRQKGCSQDYTPAAAVTAGTVIQLPDGRAAVPANDLEASRRGAVTTEGVFRMQKTANLVILDGGEVYWDVSAGKAHFRPEAGQQDFYIGVAVGDAAAADTTVDVRLNVRPNYTIDLHGGGFGAWVTEATDGLGVTLLPGGGAQLAFDAVAEVAQAALYSAHTVPVSAKPILRARVAVFAIGDNAALDINVGLASGSHATDFESVANFVGIQLDGASLNINVHSDDGTTDVAPVDSTIDAVDDTYFEVWIDCRDPDDVQVYVNGVDAVPAGTTLTLAAASNALRPIAHIEKTSDDTVADLRVTALQVRTCD